MENADQKNEGYLVIRASSAGNAIPIEGATVVVREVTENGDTTLLTVMNTDESGQTVPFPVATPSRTESLSPGGKKPYTPLVVEIYADGYYGITNVGVPIYPGVTSIQPARMIPVSEEDAIRYPIGNTFVNEDSKGPNL